MTVKPSKRVRRQRWYMTISLVLILFILGTIALFTFHTQSLTHHLKEQINLIVELNTDAVAPTIEKLERHLMSQNYVNAGAVRFVSKEEGAQSLREDFGDDFLELGLPNPLRDIFVVNLKSTYVHADSLGLVKSDIMQFDAVQDIYYQQELLKLISDNVQRLTWGSSVLGIILLLVAIALIHNTVGLSLFADRFLIKNMQLVGATWAFIRRPYLKRNFWISIIAALLAAGGVILLSHFLNRSIPGLNLLKEPFEIGIFVVIILVFSVILVRWSTRRSVNRYLRGDTDDLYNA